MDFVLNRVLRVGTRTSTLALRQVDEVLGHLKGLYPGLKFEIVGIDTYGDKDRRTPISDIEGTDFFTREIEDALSRGEVDFAVHSAKDLPDGLREGLCIAAITKSIDPQDALVSKNNVTIDRLRSGAKIGASSRRRKGRLKRYRPDLQVVDIRGDILERLKKLEEGDLDAVVAACCALMRLGLEKKIAQRIPSDILTPHPLQGCLAVEVKSRDEELRGMLEALNGR